MERMKKYSRSYRFYRGDLCNSKVFRNNWYHPYLDGTYWTKLDKKTASKIKLNKRVYNILYNDVSVGQDSNLINDVIYMYVILKQMMNSM